MSPSDAILLDQIRWSIAALRVSLAFIRVDLALRGYDPNQPRVPAGRFLDALAWCAEALRAKRAGRTPHRAFPRP